MRRTLLFVMIFMILIVLSGCKNPTEITIDTPKVTTADVSTITFTSAQCGGIVTSEGGASVTARGVCWSTNQTPSVSDNKTTDSTGTGNFTSNITGLIPNSTYFIRAYATNSEGTGYGSIKSFTTVATTMTDIEGNVYQVVIIGNQIWMAENLKVTRYRNGDVIPNVTNNSEWGNLTTGAYCNYDNNTSHVATYGRLYNWYTVDDSRNIAPEGWHIPSDEEWKDLEMYLGMSQSEADTEGARGTDEGGKLKEAGTTHWVSPNTGATNESGFTALPHGHRTYHGEFFYMGLNATFWTSDESNSNHAPWYRNLNNNFSGIYRGTWGFKESGLSIRCLRD
jgi:uncharacterized protein (TIGR02145 family)